ncbi:probable serine/threonine-protein kinase DDB_G0281745 [Corticium candelabrum]|uniref:probable serine/threonine-protein kinase DDB_G0281745 n=1 Tax=Corticium candelabrum TaxID=121492 RepID=UPI002E259841|nr:probable serine/threonine-protein kinase DDB_G0281745 [Corticium candelabrum]XP_062523533.1 probable serine/threonine-protein kinase DDB_G0281745 [Corticium candelabrum]
MQSNRFLSFNHWLHHQYRLSAVVCAHQEKRHRFISPQQQMKENVFFMSQTTTPVRQSPKQDSGKGDEQLVKQLMQRIEQLTQDGSAKDRQNRELKQRNADIEKSLRDEQLRRQHAVTQERREKEELQRRLRERDQQVVEVRQQNTELQRLLRNEQLQREDSVAKEKREKVELRQVLQRVLEDKHNLQKNLDEAQQHIQQLIEEKNNLQRLLIEKRREKSNIEELLADADAAIERYKQRQRNEVLNIPSHDIQLTNTELGRGSYGAVCVGYWRGCPVAVKSLYEDLAAVQRNVQLVQQEASVAWKIHHPNIATVCGVTLEVEGKRAWIIVELHSGSMSGVIDACQGDVAPLTLRETVDMTYDSLCGLDYIHSMQPREILHGDICPRNILVTPTMRAKLGDLGAARFQDVSLSVGLLSPQYTPPERFDVPTLPKNKATDMYSMGVTICELFTAAFPDRELRMDQVLLIRQIDVRSVCKHLMRENPVTRPTAAEARHVIGRIRETDEYKACPSKRMVKGKMDGIADVTLV